MKTLSAGLLALASAASAHYTFPSLIANGVVTGEWEYVRQTENHYSNAPVTDVSSEAIRCYENPGRPAAKTLSVAAGSTVGFTVSPSIYHPGPLQFYMARVPDGQTADSWDGSGQVWFKIFEQGPQIDPSGLTWPSDGLSQVQVTIPSSLPSGDYLLRVEQIGLHSASSVNGAQFYLSCAQLTVTGGGNGNPGPLVSFPGAYSPTDPGLLINIYWPIPTSYELPGPPVWRG
uniref:AA9 family lytic polysaccharide monooxygenase H n=1 Tax=Malbranchea cinnamomea TaxID=5041 RepID=LP9H_MALCI|nr:LPMO9H [Malbranchea cinnamomea]